MNTLTTPPPFSLELPFLQHPHSKFQLSIQHPNQRKKKRGCFKCRAELMQDAPFAIAIGTCVLNSLVFPLPKSGNDDDSDTPMDSTDARFAVMGIISFIPYFNWLSWVFAWLDTGSKRYVVYSIVYLAPYLRTNLSLSPEESWLPIASIFFCIIHIQLEASIKNGDLQGFQIFNEALKYGSPLAKKNNADLKVINEGISKKVFSSQLSGMFYYARQMLKMLIWWLCAFPKLQIPLGRKQEHQELPSANEQSRNELHGWGVPEKPLDKQTEETGDTNK